MTATYEKIATTTVSGSSVATVTFSTITGSYTDLVLISNVKAVTAGASVQMRFNSDTGNNYSYVGMYGDGTTVGSTNISTYNRIFIGAIVRANAALEMAIVTNIQNYLNTTTYKTVLSRANRASSGNTPGTEATVSTWQSTSAITTIDLTVATGNIDIGSTFTLYGIKSE